LQFSPSWKVGRHGLVNSHAMTANVLVSAPVNF
jgi:hypothetical protein